MARARSARAMKTRKEETRIHNLPHDRANEANKMFIIWLCWLFRFWKGDQELEVRIATYGPGIDQSQHAKSVSHIINHHIHPDWPHSREPCLNGLISLLGLTAFDFITDFEEWIDSGYFTEEIKARLKGEWNAKAEILLPMPCSAMFCVP